MAQALAVTFKNFSFQRNRYIFSFSGYVSSILNRTLSKRWKKLIWINIFAFFFFFGIIDQSVFYHNPNVNLPPLCFYFLTVLLEKTSKLRKKLTSKHRLSKKTRQVICVQHVVIRHAVQLHRRCLLKLLMVVMAIALVSHQKKIFKYFSNHCQKCFKLI